MIAIAAAALAVLFSLLGLGACLACRRDVRHAHESFESRLVSQRTEWREELAKEMETLRVEQTEMARPERRQAMQMFRAGIAPDTVAVRLGLPRREMRLAAKVFGILAAKS
jgi:hypothetical protein